MRNHKITFALIFLFACSHEFQGKRARGEEGCIENKAEAIANAKNQLQHMQDYLEDNKRIKKLANTLKASGHFSGHRDITRLEMEMMARDFVASQIEQAKEQLSSLRNMQDCSEHGATRFCIENKSISIEKTNKNTQLATKTLSKPSKLAQLGDQLIVAQNLNKNMSQREMIELAARFIREQIMANKQKIASMRKRPDCSEPGAIRRCIQNRGEHIQKASAAIKDAHELLAKPEELKQLADQLTLAGSLPQDLSQQKKINATKTFIRKQITTMTEQLGISMQRPDCAP